MEVKFESRAGAREAMRKALATTQPWLSQENIAAILDSNNWVNASNGGHRDGPTVATADMLTLQRKPSIHPLTFVLRERSAAISLLRAHC